MTYSGSMILEMIPSYFCIFCYHLPFEEDLALHLKNLESQLPKDDLYYV
jgi:hypothetical protein